MQLEKTFASDGRRLCEIKLTECNEKYEMTY